MIKDIRMQDISVKASHPVEPNRLAIWKTFQSDIRRFVHSRVKDKVLTEDIVQDVFLKTYERINSVRDSTKIKSWLLTLTHNTIIDHFRKANRTTDPLYLVPEVEDSNLNECVSRYMKKLVETLPEKYRQALQLTDLGSMSQIEMANHFRISISGAKSRVQRARSILRKRLQEDLGLETDRYGNVLACECSNQ